MDISFAFTPSAMASPPVDSWFPSPELRAILQSADRRLQSWQRPPNWSVMDWSAECRQIEEIAAYKLTRAVDSAGNIPPARSIYNHVIASVRTCYRREWAYSLHFEPCPMNLSSREQEFEGPRDGQTAETDPYSFLYEAMDELAPEQRRLVEQLFFFGRTQAEVGKIFGLSQRAISKRKQHALNNLCTSLRQMFIAGTDWPGPVQAITKEASKKPLCQF